MLGTLVTVASPKTAIKEGRLALQSGIPLIVDSGAWSNFNGKADVTVEKHMAWLQQNWFVGARHVGLDVIGDTKSTFENWLIEVKTGFQVEPTIHYPEEPKSVDRYVKAGFDFEWLNLGGMAHLQKNKQLLPNIAGWSASVMRRLPPEVKVHGLGATSPGLCDLVPFDGVDSTYWLEVHKFNTIVLFSETTRHWIRVLRSLRAKDWDHGKKQRLGSQGDVLQREYGVSATQIHNADQAFLIELAVKGQERFARYYSRRHDKQVLVYMAGATTNEFKYMKVENNA